MKIGVNALFLIPGEVGGAETYFRRTFAALAEHHPEHSWVVFANRESLAVLAEDLRAHAHVCLVDMRVRAMNRTARIMREQLDLPRLVRRAGVDVLWSPGYTMPLVCPCPRLTSILDLQYKRFPEDFPFVARWATRLLVGAACRYSERLVAISEFSRQELICFTDVPIGRIDVTPLAASPCFAERLPGDALAERALALTRAPGPFLLSVSNSYPHKSLETAVAAFGRLAPRIPHRLVIVGRPRRGEAALADAIRRLPDPERVVRLHYVAGDDLVALYQAADVFLFPSRYEGFGLPVLEALAAGVPVVAARAGSVPEVGGEAVTYVRPGDDAGMAEAVEALLRLAPESRAARVAAGRARAARFTWETTAAATLAACERTAAVRRR